MTHPELYPFTPATPAALGEVFRLASGWLQEHGTITIGQILNPRDGDDQAPSFEFDGDVISTLLPQAAALLEISPHRQLSCQFYPAYLSENPDTESTTINPPECVFSVLYTDRSSIVESVNFEIILDDMESEDWLGGGSKMTDYRRGPLRPMTHRELTRNVIEAIFLGGSIPNDLISSEECEALQAITQNLDLLKQLQDNHTV